MINPGVIWNVKTVSSGNPQSTDGTFVQMAVWVISPDPDNPTVYTITDANGATIGTFSSLYYPVFRWTCDSPKQQVTVTHVSGPSNLQLTWQ